MPQNFLDQQEIDIPCPQCGHESSKSVRWLQANERFTCACGAVIVLEHEQFRAGIKQAEKSLNELGETLAKLGKPR